ncbi:MAG: hypothetical protein ABSG65_28435 [Bryobacteraceae bacterium]|jgi:hypothetical protein
MRIFLTSSAVSVAALAWLPFAAPAQTLTDACDPPAAIQALSPERHAGTNLSDTDRSARIAKIREALAQSPDDLFLNRWLIELQPKPQTGKLASEFQASLAKPARL